MKGCLTVIGGGGDRSDPISRALDAKFKACKAIVWEMDGDRFSVKEHGYFNEKCLEVGPQIFVDRVAQGVFNLREANR